LFLFGFSVRGLLVDKQDWAILSLLQQDVTLPVAELAERVGISKSACWRRIQKLEVDGVIRERVALLSQDKVNLALTVYISVRTRHHNDDWPIKFRQVIDSIEGVLEVYRMSGDLDYLIKAVVVDMPGYDKLYQQLIKADLQDVSSSFVMETMKQTTRLPLPR
jgi:Lrp/AsnC family transcriptional regulator